MVKVAVLWLVSATQVAVPAQSEDGQEPAGNRDPHAGRYYPGLTVPLSLPLPGLLAALLLSELTLLRSLRCGLAPRMHMQGVAPRLDRAIAPHPCSGAVSLHQLPGPCKAPAERPRVRVVRPGTEVAQSQAHSCLAQSPLLKRGPCVLASACTKFPKAGGRPPAQGAPGGNSSQCSCIVRGARLFLVFPPPRRRPQALCLLWAWGITNQRACGGPSRSSSPMAWPAGCSRSGHLQRWLGLGSPHPVESSPQNL